jgi:hypothetical protein
VSIPTQQLALEIKTIGDKDANFNLARKEIAEDAHYVKAFIACGVLEMVEFYDEEMSPLRLWVGNSDYEIVAYVDPCQFNQVALHKEMLVNNLLGTSLEITEGEEENLILVTIGKFVGEQEAKEG